MLTNGGSTTPPPRPVLAPAIDRLIGRELAGDLAVLFEKIACSVSSLLSEKSLQQIQAYIKRFLFDSGYQEIGVRITNNATNVVIRHTTIDSKPMFPSVADVGDMDLLSQFAPVKIAHGTKNTTVNQLRNTLCILGMVPMLVFAQKLRDAIKMGVKLDGRTPNQQGEELIKALADCFPAGNEFAAGLLDMDTVHIELIEVEGGYRGIIRGEFDVHAIKKLYPSLERLLSHLAEYEIAILDPWTSTTTTAEASASNKSKFEVEVAQGKCMMTIRILQQRGGTIAFECTVVVSKTTSTPDVAGELLWFDRATGLPTPFSAVTKTWPVDFDERRTGVVSKFRIVVHGTFRIPQLGCGSITAPLVVLEMRYRSSQDAYRHPYGTSLAPACKFDITMLHMSEPSRITSYLIRPFINMDFLRFILLNHMHIQFEINPPRRPSTTSNSIPKHPSLEPVGDLYDAEDDDDVYFDAMDTVVDVTQPVVTSETHLIRQGSITSARATTWSRRGEEPWQLNFRFIMFLPPPPRVVASCLSMFVGEQLESPDELKMWVDMLQSLAADLKGINARLAREQGDIDAARMAEEDNKMQREHAIEYRRQEVEKQANKHNRRKWLMCFGGR